MEFAAGWHLHGICMAFAWSARARAHAELGQAWRMLADMGPRGPARGHSWYHSFTFPVC